MNDPETLVSRLTEAREAYYNTDTPLIGDAEFDALEDELRKIAPGHRYFTTVGSGQNAKIRHKIPMLSMGKAKTAQEVTKWIERLDLEPQALFTIQPKIDGLSATLHYNSGTLRYAATRGDGEAGQDISHIAKYMKDIPQKITFTGAPVEIRGELHLPRDTEYDTKGKPLRNNCSGLINRKEQQDDLRFVRFLAYQVVQYDTAPLSDERLYSEADTIKMLSEQGFYTFKTWSFSGDDPKGLINRIGHVYSQYIQRLREEWNYETDGLIITVDDKRLHESIDTRWVVDHHHHYALAFKPPSQSGQAQLKTIQWQVSRQGNLSPVAVFSPVSIGGARLERASLHNADNVLRLKPAVGDTLVIERANDVIPYVRENLSGKDRLEGYAAENLWPRICPSCGSKTLRSGVHLSCPNTDCRERVLQSILFWVRQTGIEQVALKTLEILYDAGKLRTVKDLYSLKAPDLEQLDGFAEKKINSLLEQLGTTVTMSAPEFISLMGIPMVQKKSLSRLGISTLDDFLQFDDDSYVTGKRICEWKAAPGNLDFLNQLTEIINIREEQEERRGIVCLTGKAPLPRKTLTAALEERGWVVAGSVTRETNMLVCDDLKGKSSKIKKAQKTGIAIVTYQDFLKDEGIEIP